MFCPAAAQAPAGRKGAEMQKRYLEAGKFVTTHGVMGELKAYPYCDSAEFLCGFDRLYPAPGGGHPWRVEAARAHKGMALLKLEGVDSLDAARPLVDRLFYIDREDVDLPEGTRFIQDIIGLRVLDAATGEEYGTVADVTNAGAGDIYEIRTPDGRSVLFPAVPEFLAQVSPEQGFVKIRPIGGMFDDAD